SQNSIAFYDRGMSNAFIIVHLLREKLELCNKDGAHATVVHLDMRGVNPAE
ncbi:hypothetical protein L9F63_017632, partial [Diploptera punctata]